MLYCLSSSRHVVPVVAVIQPSVGEWLSLVEHLVRDQGVGGSNPLSPTISFQQLARSPILETEPLVRVLWVPQTQLSGSTMVRSPWRLRVGAPNRGTHKNFLRTDSERKCV